jgi:hypothetical protein
MINIENDDQLWYDKYIAPVETVPENANKLIVLIANNSKSVIVIPYSIAALELIPKMFAATRRSVKDFDGTERLLEYTRYRDDRLLIEIIDSEDLDSFTKKCSNK